jgi:hypothetical protein
MERQRQRERDRQRWRDRDRETDRDGETERERERGKILEGGIDFILMIASVPSVGFLPQLTTVRHFP